LYGCRLSVVLNRIQPHSTAILNPNYLALWEANAEQITARLQRINRADQEIINAIGAGDCASVEPKTQEGEKSHE